MIPFVTAERKKKEGEASRSTNDKEESDELDLDNPERVPKERGKNTSPEGPPTSDEKSESSELSTPSSQGIQFRDVESSKDEEGVTRVKLS